MKIIVLILVLAAAVFAQAVTPTICGSDMQMVATGDRYSCVSKTIATARILGNNSGVAAMPFALTTAQVMTMLGAAPAATSVTVTSLAPSASLPAASAAVLGQVYKWSYAPAPNVCPDSGSYGPASAVNVALCVTLDNATWLPVITQTAATLGSESLAQGDFTTQTKWARSGDFALVMGMATYTKSAGSGSLTQTSGNLAAAGVAGAVYKLTYDLTGTVVGDTACYVTTAFASANATLLIGTSQVVYFVAASSPGNFVITCSGTTAAAVSVDNLSLKRVLPGATALGTASVVGGTAAKLACYLADGKTFGTATITAGDISACN